MYRVPKRATRALVDLRLRWAAHATVRWSQVSFVPSAAPPKRLARLAAAHFRPENGRSPADKVRMLEPLVAEAAGRKADLIVFGEPVATHNLDSTAAAAENVPGPATHLLGEMARRHNPYIVAGTPEREGHRLYNTAALIGPDRSLRPTRSRR